ncbi:MAG: hypothetical protein NZO16_01295, partial [Deltaproteobacteria bacterium]|nr:hypothetical protein [Deltaproteobacteria bacterium]
MKTNLQLVGRSQFTTQLLRTIESHMSKKTIFFLYGPIFTGKSFFAQSFSLARSLVPVTYVPDSQSVEQNRDFFAQIENSSLKGIPLGVIVDNFENFLGDVHRIINKLESLDSCYVFLISRKEERHTLGSLDLSKWSIMELHFPPLRDRREDILPLVESFFYERYNLTPEIDEETKKVLELYEWPKNIYEIKLLVSELDSARVDVDRLP